MLDRLVPPWLLIVAGMVLFGVLGAWSPILIIALVAGHFALKHCGHEGLFGGKHKGKWKVRLGNLPLESN